MTVISRPAAAGAAAAVLLAAALVLHGAIFAVFSWFAHPWRLAALIAAALVLAAIWHGTFTRHSDRGVRAGRQERGLARADAKASAARAQREAAVVIAAIEARRPAIAPPVKHSASWGEPPTETIKFDGHLTEEQAEDFRARWEAARHEPPVVPRDCPQRPAAVEVADDPPAGRHEAPRVHAFTPGGDPYCGKCGKAGHWRGGQSCADAVVDELITRRRDGHVAAAIADHLADAGFKIHESNDAAVESMWTRAMGLGVAAIEGPKP